VAALLHDIGHFIEQRDDAFGYHRQTAAGAWLAARFPAFVSDPYLARRRQAISLRGSSGLFRPPLGGVRPRWKSRAAR